MTLYILQKSGGGRKLLFSAVSSIADTDTIDTGLTELESYVVCHGASTTIGGAPSAFDATITSVAGGVITVTVISRTNVPNLAAYAVAADVSCIAVGSIS